MSLARVTIYLPDINKGTVTDTAGVFIFHDVSNGELKLIYSLTDYKTKLKTIDFIFFCFLSDTLEPDIFKTQNAIINGDSLTIQNEKNLRIDHVQLTENPVNNISCFGEIVIVSRLLKMS